MPDRSRDWLEQAKSDMKMARQARVIGSHEWACFVSQQAGEKALKAVILHLGGESWGHALVKLADELGAARSVPEAVIDAARRLDRYYVPTRYPNGFAAGKPADYFVDEDSQDAITDAETIIAWVEDTFR